MRTKIQALITQAQIRNQLKRKVREAILVEMQQNFDYKKSTRPKTIYETENAAHKAVVKVLGR